MIRLYYHDFAEMTQEHIRAVIERCRRQLREDIRARQVEADYRGEPVVADGQVIWPRELGGE